MVIVGGLIKCWQCLEIKEWDFPHLSCRESDKGKIWCCTPGLLFFSTSQAIYSCWEICSQECCTIRLWGIEWSVRKIILKNPHLLFLFSLSGHMGQYIYIYNMLCCQCGTTVRCCLYCSCSDRTLPKVRSYSNTLFIVIQQQNIWCYNSLLFLYNLWHNNLMFYVLSKN